MASSALAAARKQLAPNGVLRCGINLSNVLLVTGKDAAGMPEGVAPDLAKSIAKALEVPAELVPFPHPDKLCEAAESNAWDICLIGADPARASKIDFTSAWCEIQATYMVPASSTKTIETMDSKGVKIASKKGGAFDLWLQRNLKNAELLQAETLDGAYDMFHSQKLDALAGLRPKLSGDLSKDKGLYKLLDGSFMSVQQALGCIKPADGSKAGVNFLSQFAEDAKKSGLLQQLIDKHGVTGKLSVAPLVGSPKL
eukprot:CAMPEP_0194763958 /NCGR_PEP_ID=MMETSP0323_2-20130528/20795_1 /TAXON_ID=2866 ORGANISM="Crypthecodinium cohnii, Strain Seligo" /NCGR_SAMPLE_ID=MMETSP0323_2 /ASSEMBLY_ACC=CAM_ASM_000346 /LENGTH=254 /DNA_ID=CAMNT_0039689999 /DNA_START=22 /DNA_END=786 /DNA_ORIENTATION=-